MAARKSTSKKSSAKSNAARKDPEGGLTAEGRKYFAKKEGAHLKPGVRGAADTPEKMRRKGSFLRRHFANPRGPMKDENGEPTRLALSAHAWGEPVPKTMADAKKLAAKGAKLLERYAKEKSEMPAKKTAAKRTSKKTPSKKSAAKRTAKKAPAKKNSLVGNINKRKKAGTSRPKSKSTISKKAYSAMEHGWPKKAATAKKRASTKS